MQILIDTCLILHIEATEKGLKKLFVYFFRDYLEIPSPYVSVNAAWQTFIQTGEIPEGMEDFCLDIITGRIPLHPSDIPAKRKEKK